MTAPLTHPASGRPKILCVDDEPRVLDGLRDTLHRSFDVQAARSGAEGLELLTAQPDAFAVVISDMRMPGISGDAFLREARIIAPDTCRILLTGQADMDAAMRAVNNAHLYRFLLKPCEPSELLRACAGALGQHRLLTGEREQLEKTLQTCVSAMIDMLALTSPAEFARGERVRKLASKLCAAAALPDVWDVEVAAMLGLVGTVTLPPDTAARFYSGESLDPEESAMVAKVPQVARDLLSEVPGLDGVREILDCYARTITPGDFPSVLKLPKSARILRVAADYAALDSRWGDADLAIATMISRQIYDRAYVELLPAVVGGTGKAPAVIEMPASDLELGMRLAVDVHGGPGNLLMCRGDAVTPQLVETLRHLGDDASRQIVIVFRD